MRKDCCGVCAIWFGLNVDSYRLGAPSSVGRAEHPCREDRVPVCIRAGSRVSRVEVPICVCSGASMLCQPFVLGRSSRSSCRELFWVRRGEDVEYVLSVKGGPAKDPVRGRHNVESYQHTMSSLLATYGTLMRTFGQQKQLGVAEQLSFVSSCRWEGRLYDLGRFPGAVPGDGIVHGELFQVQDSRVWSVLDRYEGYDKENEQASLFVRRRVELRTPSDQTAWVYWYNKRPPANARVSSGDWVAHREKTE